MAAKINSPVKNFQFRVTIPGINSWAVQKADTPDIEIDVNEHGDAGFIIKTGGMQKLGTLKIEKIIGQDQYETTVWDWIRQIRNTQLGGGDIPENYKRDILVEQLAYDGITTIQTWLYTGGWPQKINGVSFDRVGNNNTVHSIEFCVDELH